MDVDMLTAALPYVSGSVKKTLALFIKSAEVQRLFTDFDSEDYLSACGFEQDSPDPEAMLKAMKLAGGKNADPQIDQMLHIIHMVKTYQRINELMQQNPELMNLLTNMHNQPPNTSQSSQTSYSQAADLLKQFGNKDSSDMMNFLTQMLKNSR